MIALVEGAKRQKTPNEIALVILLSGLSIIFLLVVVTLPAFFGYSLTASGLPMSQNLTIPVLIALLVCLIPTTIGGLLSAIGISGMDRLIQRNVIATSGVLLKLPEMLMCFYSIKQEQLLWVTVWQLILFLLKV